MSSNGPHQRMRLAQRRQVYAVCAHKIHAARSPDGVLPRYLRPRTNAAAQLQNALPGTQLPAGVIRRPLSQSSDKVADRSSMPAGRFPVSRPGAEVTSSARGNRSCPIGRCQPVDVLWWARFAARILNGDYCQALRRYIGDLRPPCPAPRHLFGSGPGRLLLPIPEIRAVTTRRANLASRRRLRKWRIRLLGNNGAMVPDCASPGDDAGEGFHIPHNVPQIPDSAFGLRVSCRASGIRSGNGATRRVPWR